MKEIVFWENIKRKHEFQNQLYLKWAQNNHRDNRNIRNLYDFFDHRRLKIFICPDESNYKLFYFIIVSVRSRYDRLIYDSDILCSRRTHCEMEAFSKAFEILEKRTKDEETN